MSIAEPIDPLLDGVELSDPELYLRDTWHATFRRLRAEDPVHYHPRSPYGPYWSITRYDDISGVLIDHAHFSSDSALGGVLIGDQPPDRELPSFIRMDPPRHTEHRKTVAPIVGPGNLAKLEDTIVERTGHVLDSLPRSQTFDWVERVSVPLTTMMLATLFNFPWQDRHLLTYWSDVSVALTRAPDSPVRSNAERRAVLEQMADYFMALWRERAAAPPAFDLISMMAHSPATQNLTRTELIGTLALLIVGGNDTTRNTMSGGLLALSENPAEWAKLRDDPGLAEKAILEMIRWQSPVIHIRRTATADREIAGRRIAKDDKVVLWFISGNRDETAIPDADRFIVDRDKPRRHLSFGAGIHRCVGDRLAEQQLRILWQEILARDLRIEVMGPPVRLYSNFLRGIRSLPARIAA
jgi:cytochrome P450